MEPWAAAVSAAAVRAAAAAPAASTAQGDQRGGQGALVFEHAGYRPLTILFPYSLSIMSETHSFSYSRNL